MILDHEYQALNVNELVDTFRPVINYKNLNKVLVPFPYPLPRINDLFLEAGKYQYNTKLDCKSGFWQIPITSSSSKLTTFTCFLGLFEYTRLPFGLTCSSSYFQNYISTLFRSLKHIFIFIDDILICSLEEEGESGH